MTKTQALTAENRQTDSFGVNTRSDREKSKTVSEAKRGTAGTRRVDEKSNTLLEQVEFGERRNLRLATGSRVQHIAKLIEHLKAIGPNCYLFIASRSDCHLSALQNVLQIPSPPRCKKCLEGTADTAHSSLGFCYLCTVQYYRTCLERFKINHTELTFETLNALLFDEQKNSDRFRELVLMTVRNDFKKLETIVRNRAKPQLQNSLEAVCQVIMRIHETDVPKITRGFHRSLCAAFRQGIQSVDDVLVPSEAEMNAPTKFCFALGKLRNIARIRMRLSVDKSDLFLERLRENVTRALDLILQSAKNYWDAFVSTPNENSAAEMLNFFQLTDEVREGKLFTLNLDDEEPKSISVPSRVFERLTHDRKGIPEVLSYSVARFENGVKFPGQTGEAVSQLINFERNRELLTGCPILQEIFKGANSRHLQALKEEELEGVFMGLGQEGKIGMQVRHTYEEFENLLQRTVNMIFCKMTFDEANKRLRYSNKLSGEKLEIPRLKAELTTLDSGYRALLDESQTIKSNKRADFFSSKVTSLGDNKKPVDCLPLVISALTSWNEIVRFGERKSKSSDLVVLNHIQRGVVLQLLAERTSDSIELAQVLTGEGKSLILAVTAACFALTGMKVDILCYSRQLTNRDETKFNNFFEFLSIQSLVRYVTLKDLMIQHLRRQQTLCWKMWHSEFVDSGAPITSSTTRGEALIIDEIDTLLSSHSRAPFQGGIRVPCKAIRDVVTALRCNSIERFNFAAFRNQLCFELTSLIHISPEELIPFANKIIKSLERGNHLLPTGNPIDCLSIQGRSVHVQDSDDTTSENLFVSDFIGTFFYFDAVKDKKIEASEHEDNKHYSIQLPAGACCVSSIFCGRKRIVGVTGTLEVLPQSQIAWLTTALTSVQTRKEPSLRFTFAETAYDKIISQSLMDVNRCFCYPNFSELCQGLLQQTENHLGRINGRSALILFESYWQLREAEKEFKSKQFTVACLTLSTNQPEIRNLVNDATFSPRNCMKVTLAVAEFGRGTDFLDVEDFLVIQAFWTPFVENIVQNAGRACRRGKVGQFRVCFDTESTAKFLRTHLIDVSAEIITKEQNVTRKIDCFGRSYYLHLPSLADKVLTYCQQRSNISAQQQFVQSVETAISRLSDNVDRCLTEYITKTALEVFYEPRSLLFILDSSRSMYDCWENVKKCFQVFFDDLDDGVQISVITFNDAATIVQQPKFKRDLGNVLAGVKSPYGGTQFSSAFQIACTIDDVCCAPLEIFFLTDGESADKESDVEASVEQFLKCRAVLRLMFVRFGKAKGPSMSFKAPFQKWYIPVEETTSNVEDLKRAFDLFTFRRHVFQEFLPNSTGN